MKDETVDKVIELLVMAAQAAAATAILVTAVWVAHTVTYWLLT